MMTKVQSGEKSVWLVENVKAREECVGNQLTVVFWSMLMKFSSEGL